MKELSYEEIEAATQNFDPSQLIGKGSHGSVYRGTLGDGRIVAVKKPSGGVQSLQNHAKLNNEIDVLASLRDPPISIVEFVGFTRAPASCRLLVMEFLPNGSLHALIHASPTPPEWRLRGAIALQIARAVLYLHEASPASVVHRDVKSANVLLDGKWNAKLCDFGLAARPGRNDDERSETPPPPAAGTIGYMDPCYTEPGKLGPENDVFSFGVVLLELLSSRKAIDVERDPSSVVAWVLGMAAANRSGGICDERVALPEYMRRAVGRMLRVAVKCVSEKAERRPAMREVVGELEAVVEGLAVWTAWGCVRSKVSERVQGCVRAWRRCAEKRVGAAATANIVCGDHLVDGGDHDSREDDRERGPCT
ncbi:serine/threonine-protein kinase-like protein At5g23170 [Zingiber officinale]|uniref:Protein kinase domain-containing protein n=1 Tax=Zingiber officinale TaxID=94328 RepID=A0A8J5BSG2_ZINOF|nr:serine/threonine-protein kinase-like protein At5g23170 [Zingiber officinale]KAG6466247.1 hypothetical protein ZIOFF_075966 [Zingiber officinale]